MAGVIFLRGGELAVSVFGEDATQLDAPTALRYATAVAQLEDAHLQTALGASQPQAPGSLQAALLTMADLSAGWQAQPADTSSATNTNDLTTCDGQQVSDRSLTTVGVNFLQPQGLQFLSESVSTYAPGGAQSDLAAVAALVNGCSSWTLHLDDGTAVPWTIASVAVPTLGDQSGGYAISLQLPEGTLAGDLIFVRHGDYVMVVGYLALNGRVDHETTLACLRKADAKLSDYLASRARQTQDSP